MLQHEMTKAVTSNAKGGPSSITGTFFFICVTFTTVLLSLVTLKSSICSGIDLVEMSYHVRGKLARTLVNKLREDEEDENSTHERWYAVKKHKLPKNVSEIFLPSHQDPATESFLQSCKEKSDWLFTQMYHGVVATLLSLFMSQTSINGFLRRGSMFVFSTNQFRDLLGIDSTWKEKRLLDLGAGDGMVTQQMSGHFEEVYVTEMSTTMIWRLREKGFRPLGLTEWNNGSLQYDLISCLNVLDRCDEPVTLLSDMKNSLLPATGRIVVAMVLPYSPYVEFKYRNHKPKEEIPVTGSTFEEQVSSLITDFFEPHGFKVEKFTRVPYLCEGDLEHSYYVLHDAVFVLSVRDPS